CSSDLFDISTEDLAGFHFDTEPAKRTVTKGCTEQFAALQLTAGKLPGVKTGTPAVLQVITVTYGRQIRRLTGGLDGAGDLCSCGPAGFSILSTHLVPAGPPCHHADPFTLFDHVKYRIPASRAAVHFNIRIDDFKPQQLFVRVCG